MAILPYLAFSFGHYRRATSATQSAQGGVTPGPVPTNQFDGRFFTFMRPWPVAPSMTTMILERAPDDPRRLDRRAGDRQGLLAIPEDVAGDRPADGLRRDAVELQAEGEVTVAQWFGQAVGRRAGSARPAGGPYLQLSRPEMSRPD